MKLYAIRDKKTKKLSLLAESPMSLWDSFGMAEYALKISCDPQTDEVITLRIEPTEPCEWCDVNDGAWCATYDGRMIALDNEGSPETLLAENWSFCPNCGRGLA